VRVSIVLPSFNSQEYLPKTLASLCKQDFEPSEFEILVVDCSEHDQVAQVCAQFPQVSLRRESVRFNPGRGRNIGAQHASGKLVIFLDTDVSLRSDALTEAWNFYQAGHPIFGGALELDRDVNPDLAAYLEHFYFNHESQKGRPQCERNNLSSALMLFDRDLFLKVGGFTDIPRMQDTELTERLVRAGHTLMFCPKVVGWQIQDAPLGKVLRKILINGKNLYFLRYQQLPAAKKLAFSLLLPLLTAVKVTRIIGRQLVYQDTHGRLITIGLVPWLGLGGLCWMYGLYASLLFGGGISTRRD
jgi:glycosyltransferase involved in cell wall biosynthesis